MGYTKVKHANGIITNFWPDDTEDTMYLAGSHSFNDIIEYCQEKWPDISMDNITISTEDIHTDCIYYDLYDAGDHTTFLVITKE